MKEYGSEPAIGNQWIFAITKVFGNSTEFNGVDIPFVITLFGPVESGKVDWECIIHDEQRNFNYFPIRSSDIEVYRGESKEDMCSSSTLPGKHTVTISISDPQNKQIFHTVSTQQDVSSSLWKKLTPVITADIMNLLKIDLDQSKYPGIVAVYIDPKSNFDEMRITADGKIVSTYNKSDVSFLRLDENSGDIEIYLIKHGLEYPSILLPSAYAINSNPIESEDIHIMYSKSDLICTNVNCIKVEKEEFEWPLFFTFLIIFFLTVGCISVHRYFKNKKKQIDIIDEGEDWTKIVSNKSIETGGITNGIL